MVVELITAESIVSLVRDQLGVPSSVADPFDERFIAEHIRHSAASLCPCSRQSLRRTVLAALDGLPSAYADKEDRVDHAIEALVSMGDLLELCDVTTADDRARGTWVYAAPPGFIERKNGVIHLIGIVPDMETFLPQKLADRIERRGYDRRLCPEDGEDLPDVLEEFGFHKRSLSNWLSLPRQKTAAEVVADLESRLLASPVSGQFDDLEILDGALPPTHYRRRWGTPDTRSGMFVARRKQDFGAPLWCVVKLHDGRATHLTHLPLNAGRWRACDDAWLLQMAIDALQGNPQVFTTCDNGACVTVEFYSPVPAWAHRQLLLEGTPREPQTGLFALDIPVNCIEEQRAFLMKSLWMTVMDME